VAVTLELETLARDLEHFETPRWAPKAILRHELLTHSVVDPCVGSGVMADAARDVGADVLAFDIHDWGYPGTRVVDWLSDSYLRFPNSTCFMNPPFSLAISFLEKCFEREFRKIIMFQRFAFWESQKRREFWAQHPPSRIYICGDRADCWRHDIPADKRGSSTPTAHAFFVYERGHPPGTLVGHIYKDAGA
jgi:hypothetical protein